MPNDRDTSDDVSGVSAVNLSVNQAKPLNDRLHHSRAAEYLLSQAVGISVAIGAATVARQVAPGAMQSLSRFVEGAGSAYWKGESAAYQAKQASRIADYVVMFGAGFVTTACTQITLARRRRQKRDMAGDISISRDAQRVMAGWGIGFFGASASIALADRYLRRGSQHTISPLMNQAEAWLDKRLFNNLEFAEGRKLSEALVGNVAMLPGGAPMSVVGQRLYDAMIAHPAYEKDR